MGYGLLLLTPLRVVKKKILNEYFKEICEIWIGASAFCSLPPVDIGGIAHGAHPRGFTFQSGSLRSSFRHSLWDGIMKLSDPDAAFIHLSTR